MSKKLWFAIFGLALLCASQSWAGGGGGAQRSPVAQPHYTYCFAGDARTRTAYFSAVITSAPTADVGGLNEKSQDSFNTYLKTRGAENNGSQCYSPTERAAAVLGIKQHEAQLVARKWKIVETGWAGNP